MGAQHERHEPANGQLHAMQPCCASHQLPPPPTGSHLKKLQAKPVCTNLCVKQERRVLLSELYKQGCMCCIQALVVGKGAQAGCVGFETVLLPTRMNSLLGVGGQAAGPRSKLRAPAKPAIPWCCACCLPPSPQ